MPIVSEIIVNGTLTPSISNQPTHSDQYGEGGYRAVGDSTDRSLIPSGQLTEGMLVHLNDTQQTFRLNGSGGWDINGFIADRSIATIKLALLSVTSAELDSNAVTTAKLDDNSVTNNKMADGAAISIVSPQNVFDGLAPIVAQDLELSGGTGTTSECLAFLTITNYGANASFYFGPSGDVYDAGVSTISLNTSQKGMIQVISTPSSIIQWSASSAVSATVDIVSYIR